MRASSLGQRTAAGGASQRRPAAAGVAAASSAETLPRPVADPVPRAHRRVAMPSALEQQRAAPALILTAIGGDAFALAGSGAIREHGVILRATQDIDLFTNDTGIERFAATVQRAITTLTDHGFQAVLARSAAQFAAWRSPRATATSSRSTSASTGEPTTRSGSRSDRSWPSRTRSPNKIGALYSRAAARDYLDVDTIRQTDPSATPRSSSSPPNTTQGSTRSSSPKSSATLPSCGPRRSLSTASPPGSCRRCSNGSRHGASGSCGRTPRILPRPPPTPSCSTHPGPTPAANHHDTPTGHHQSSQSERRRGLWVAEFGVTPRVRSGWVLWFVDSADVVRGGRPW